MSIRTRTWTIFGSGVALALTVTAAPAAEDTSSANYMLPGCRDFIGSWVSLELQGFSRSQSFRIGDCEGFVAGIAHMGRAVHTALSLYPPQLSPG